MDNCPRVLKSKGYLRRICLPFRQDPVPHEHELECLRPSDRDDAQPKKQPNHLQEKNRRKRRSLSQNQQGEQTSKQVVCLQAQQGQRRIQSRYAIINDLRFRKHGI